jgi:hypothetical protein
MFKKIMIALGITVAGFTLGGILVRIASWPPVAKSAQVRIPGFQSRFTAQLGAFATSLARRAYFVWPSRRQHNQLKAALTRAFPREHFLSRVYASEDGRYGYLPLRAGEDIWNETHRWLHRGTHCTTPKRGTQSGFYDFVFVEKTSGKGFSVLPADSAECSAEIKVIFKYSAKQRLLISTLVTVHRVFSEIAIPVVAPALTSSCESLITSIRMDQEQRWKDYCSTALWPYVAMQTTELPRPSPGLFIGAVEIIAKRSKSAPPITFREDIVNGSKETGTIILHTMYLFPFGSLKQATLEEPRLIED